MKRIIVLFVSLFIISAHPVFAVSDPRLSPNNKVGINVISPEAEIGDVASLVDTNGDWGWMVITITKNDRNVERLQSILNQANKNHIIPIIRLATEFDAKNGYWKRPDDSDAAAWADFLSQLYFPTSNRYVEVYNEVNRAAEWGGKVDPADYARVLDDTIDALKAKTPDFFVLNSPLDLSLVNSTDSQDAADFFAEMDSAIPGIFSILDGWASHSYPNPNFSASPYESGRTGINGYSWELNQISKYTKKDLPVFITETGWKRNGLGKDGVSEDQISKYYEEAFSNVWNDSRIVAVAPFLLSYPEPLFNQFSFETSGPTSGSVFYKYFSTIQNLQKIKGLPERENLVSDIKIDYSKNSIDNIVNLKFKNVGNYVWNSGKDLSIKVSGQDVIVAGTLFDKKDIYPGDEVGVAVKMENTTGENAPIQISITDNNQILAKKEMMISGKSSFPSLGSRVKTASAIFKTGSSNLL